jgi:hypothetical protein
MIYKLDGTRFDVYFNVVLRVVRYNYQNNILCNYIWNVEIHVSVVQNMNLTRRVENKKQPGYNPKVQNLFLPFHSKNRFSLL